MGADTAAGELLTLNEQIPEAENTGATTESREFFGKIISMPFAFRKANQEIVGRDDFINALASGGDRVAHGHQVTLLGNFRALVTCVVTMTVGGEKTQFDNARLWFLDEAGQWRLLGWANERQEC